MVPVKGIEPSTFALQVRKNIDLSALIAIHESEKYHLKIWVFRQYTLSGIDGRYYNLATPWLHDPSM